MNDNVTRAPQHRLHNSGAGRREVFRCARISNNRTLDLFKALNRCAAIPPAAVDECVAGINFELLKRPNTRPADPARVRFHADGVSAVAVALLHALGGASDVVAADTTHEHAIALSERVVRLVVENGWHREALGLASHTELPRNDWRTDARIGFVSVPVQDAALAFAAFAVYTPPLILWSRKPSLDWLRVDVCIESNRLWNEGGRS